MKELARRLTLEAATALLACGTPKDAIPEQLAKWALEWLKEK